MEGGAGLPPALGGRSWPTPLSRESDTHSTGAALPSAAASATRRQGEGGGSSMPGSPVHDQADVDAISDIAVVRRSTRCWLVLRHLAGLALTTAA